VLVTDGEAAALQVGESPGWWETMNQVPDSLAVIDGI